MIFVLFVVCSQILQSPLRHNIIHTYYNKSIFELTNDLNFYIENLFQYLNMWITWNTQNNMRLNMFNTKKDLVNTKWYSSTESTTYICIHLHPIFRQNKNPLTEKKSKIIFSYRVTCSIFKSSKLIHSFINPTNYTANVCILENYIAVYSIYRKSLF